MSDLLTEVQPVAPFQLAMMLGTEDDPNVRVHLVDQDIPTMDRVDEIARQHMNTADYRFFDWDYVVYDANHNEVRRTRVADVQSA